MDFFGIGMLEVLLILAVALIIFGPGRLPEISRTLGKTMRTLKKATSDLTAQMAREIESEKEHPPESAEKKSDRTDKSAGP